MQIFHYDPNTGEFVGSGAAEESPLEPGVFLVPAHATDLPPPGVVDGKRRVFYDGGWVLLDAATPESPVQEVPDETLEQTVARYTAALDAHLNAPAHAKGYDSIHTAALRAAYPGPWHDEGLAFATWMDQCNALGYQVLAEVQAGTRPQPTVAEFLALLPACPVQS